VSCDETAQRFGRDVYLSKDEAMMLADEPAVGLSSANKAAVAGDDKGKALPPVQEGDFLLFQVKLSTEGFPQAVQAQKIRRLRGAIVQAPSATADGIIVVSGDDERVEATPHCPDAALKQLLGAEVRLRQAECGQLRLQPNDQVAFCCVTITDSDGQCLEAQLVDLLQTSLADGSLLGCFSLSLPQLSSTDDNAPNLELHGHALRNRVLISDDSAGLSEAGLMRLFGKLGGIEAKVTPSKGSASVTFNGVESVAKFLAQATHTVSENGITQLAHVSSCDYRKCGGYCYCCSGASMSKQTAPAAASACPQAMQMPSAQVVNCSPCIAVADVSQTMAHSAPMLSTQATAPSGPMLSTLATQVPIVQNSVNFGCFAEQSLEQNSISFGCFPAQYTEMSMLTRTSASPDWRCMHGNVVIPSAAPEILQAGDYSCGVCIQWPTVIHASAYVVELLDQTTMVAQRFLHGTPEGVLPSLMNLGVDGLQATAYAACVRCVAPCGCESAASSWSFVSGMAAMAPAMNMLQPQAPAPHHMMQPAASMPNASVVLPHACPPPPPSAPPSFPASHTMPTLPLAPIPEEAAIVSESGCEDILTLD